MAENRYELFVYGTLLGSYDRSTPSRLPGFERNDAGPYPTVVPGDGHVDGEVVPVGPDELTRLDRYEGYTPGDSEGSLYVRLSIGDDVQVYVANAERFSHVQTPIDEMRQLLADTEVEPR